MFTEEVHDFRYLPFLNPWWRWTFQLNKANFKRILAILRLREHGKVNGPFFFPSSGLLLVVGCCGFFDKAWDEKPKEKTNGGRTVLMKCFKLLHIFSANPSVTRRLVATKLVEVNSFSFLKITLIGGPEYSTRTRNCCWSLKSRRLWSYITPIDPLQLPIISILYVHLLLFYQNHDGSTPAAVAIPKKFNNF